ncbi:MAG: hypothetical protein V4683_07560 [Bacteroidota bacterium]
MKRSMIFKSLSIIMVAGAVWGCSSKQIATQSGKEVYDDLYTQVGESSPIGVTYENRKNNAALNQNPEAEDGRAYNDGENITNEYYAESGVDARDYQRNATDRPGYGDYTDGYRDGVTDSRYNWGNNWNNGFNAFNRYNYWNSFGGFYNPGVTIIIGGRNRFGSFFNPYSTFGYDPFYAYSPFGFGGFNSFGYGGFNSFGYGGLYDPFYNNFYNPYGYGGGYGGGWFSSPRYYSGGYANNNLIGADRANRNYGPRNGGRNSAGYNDQFVNTAKPRTTADPNMRKGTVYTDPSNVNAGAYGSGTGYSAKARGGYSGNNSTTNPNAKLGTVVDSRNSDSRTTETYSTRSRGGFLRGGSQSSSANTSNARPSADPSNENTYYAKPNRLYSNGNTPSGAAGTVNNSGGTYNRGSSGQGSSNPNYNIGRSNNSSGGNSSSYGSGNSSNSRSYSSGSSSSGSSGSSSGSRGSSSGSSSGGGGSSGGSRGPR